jgi:peptidylprolyl isomerase
MNKNLLIVIGVIILILVIIIIGIYFTWQKPGKTGEQNNSNSYTIQGMKIDILKQGTGEGAKTGDNVVVNYVGTLQDGTKFDSSIDRGQPFPMTLGQNRVIQGWELGLLGMKVGEKRKLTIPPELGYGAQKIGELIPANSTLIFEIDLLSINQK